MSAIEAVFYADDRSSQGQKNPLISTDLPENCPHTFIFGRDVIKTLPFYGTGR
jgi:hypothetical protein